MYLEADVFAASYVGPVVVVLPSTVQGNAKITTPAGRKPRALTGPKRKGVYYVLETGE